MRRFTSATTLALAAVTVTATPTACWARDTPADPTHLYVVVDAGNAKVSHDCASSVNCQRVQFTPRVHLGYRFNPQVAAELGYGAVDMSSWFGDYGMRLDSLTASLVLSQPLGDAWSLQGRLGLSQSHTRADLPRPGSFATTRQSANDTAPWVGLGVQWRLTRLMHLELGADWTQAKVPQQLDTPPQTRTVRWMGVGVGFNF